MKKILLILAISVSFLSIHGCSSKPEAQNAQQAIEQSKTKSTPEAQADYLIGQANAFINSKQFNESIATAQYVLANLDANSEKAKQTIEKAGQEIKKAAEEELNKMQKSMEGLGK